MQPWLDEAEPVAEPTPPAPAPVPAPQSAPEPSTSWLSEAVDVDARQAGNDERLRVMFESGLQKSVDDHAAISELVRQSRLPADVVEQKLPEFRQRAQAAQFDPARFRAENPELYQLFLEHPEAGRIVTRDVKASKLVEILGILVSEPGTPALSEQIIGEEQMAAFRAEFSAIHRDYQRGLLSREERQAREADLEQRMEVASTRRVAGVEESKDDLSALEKVFGKGDKPGVLGSAYRQGSLVVDRAALGREWSWRVLHGESTWDVEKQLLDLENRMVPRLYGDGEWTAVLQATGELLPAQIQSYKGAGIGGAGGAAVGGAIGHFIPGVGWKQGAKVGARIGSKGGMWVATFLLEQGNAAADYRSLRTDDGRPVDPDVAVGWSIAYGVISATIETGSEFSKLGSFGPLGEMARKGELREAGKALVKDPRFRALLAKVAKGYAGNIVTESGEEGLQQLTQDVLGYLARSQEAGAFQKADVVGSVEDVVQSVEQAAVGSIIPGAAGPIVDLTTQKIAQQRAKRGQAQLRAIIQDGKDSPLAQANPDAYARLVQLATEKTGEAVTAMYVDPAAFAALFQDEATPGLSAETTAAATELMGPDGPRRLEEALATGGKIEVPIAEFAEKWRGKPIAEALVDHVAAKPFLPTAAQEAQEAAQREMQAQQVLAAIDEGKAPVSPAEAPLERLAQELVAAGRKKPDEVAADVKLWRKGLNSFAIRSGSKLEDLVQEFVVRVQSSQEAQPATAAAQLEQGPSESEKALREGYGAMEPEAQRRRFFLDANTQLFNERAWKRLPADPARPVVAHLSFEGTKWFNKVSHTNGNRAYQLAARALARVVGQEAMPAKVAGDFAFLVKDEAEAQAAAELVKQAIRDDLRAANPKVEGLEGLEVTVATAPRGENALAAWQDAGKLNAAEKKRREGLPAGARAPRGAQPKGIPVSEAAGVALPGLAAEGLTVPAELAKIDVRTEAAAGEVLIDPKTGFYSYDGFFSLPRRAAVGSIDLKGIGAINNAYGQAHGDAFLAIFAEAAKALGAQQFDFAHLSGDEYAFQADSEQDAQAFVDALGSLCDNLLQRNPDGTSTRIEFGYGIGTDYDAADGKVQGNKDAGAEAERAARAERRASRPAGGRRGDREGGGPDAAARGVGEAAPGGVREGGREDQGRPVVRAAPAFWGALRDGSRATLEALREKHGDDATSLPEYWKAEADLRRAEEALAADRLEQGSRQDRAKARELERHAAVRTEFGALMDASSGAPRSLAGKVLEIDAPATVVKIEPSVRAEVERIRTGGAGWLARLGDWAKKYYRVFTFAGTEYRLGSEGVSKTVASATGRVPVLSAIEDVVQAAVVQDPPERDESSKPSLGLVHAYAYVQEGEGPLERVRLVLKGTLDEGNRSTHRRVYTVAEVELEKAGPASISGTSAQPEGALPLNPSPPGTPTVRSLLDGVKRREGTPVLSPDGTGRLEQEPAGGGPRGWTTRVKEGLRNVFRIILTEKADPSTVLHESGHVFMDILGELASREGAAAQLVADWQATLAFIGAKDLAELQERRDGAAAIRRGAAEAGRELTAAEKDQVRELVAPFEKWARGFERYLAEGKAPSLELAGVFQRFKLWLRTIYRDISALGVELTPEIRGVFDRMLATDEEIARAREQMGPTQLFRSPEEAGLQDRPEEWAAYLERAQRAVSASTQAAQQRAAAARLQATESWWKEARAARLDDALQEYDGLPAVVALRFLRKGDPSRNAALAALGRVKLDEATVKAILSEEEVKRLRGLLQKFDRETGQGGMHPDHLAELVAPGQDLSGEDLLRQMVHLEPRTEWANARADERMAREFPDVAGEREQLRDAASRALHGDAMLTWFLHEQQVLRQRLAEATGKKLQELGAGAAGVPAESVRRAAEIMVDRMKLEKLDLGHFQQAERQAAEKAATAAAKGDYGQALVLLQQRLLNFFAVRHLQAAREVREALVEQGSDLSKDRARARLGRGSPAIRDGIEQVLEALGLGGPFPPTGAQRASLAAAVEAVEDSGVTVMFDADELARVVAQPPEVKARRNGEPAGPWRGLTVAQARNVVAALKNMRQAAGSNLTALVDGKRVDYEELVGALVEESEQNLPDRGPPASSVQAESLLQVVGGVVSGIDGELLRPETMLDWLGGKSIESWWYRAAVKPMQDAKHREADLLRDAVRPLIESMERIPAAVMRRMRETVNGRELFPDHTDAIEAPTRRYELLELARNIGNESNMERLTEGRNITREQVMRAVGLLTREELEYIQAGWDAGEELGKLDFDLEERLSGLRPEKIQPRPITVTLASGEQVSLRGGYHTVVYDPRVEVKGEKQAGDARRGVDFLDPGFIRPGTNHNHLKGRVEGASGVISLDPTIVQAHLVQVAHDIAFREAVLSVGKLFLDQRIQTALRRRLGEKRAAVFLDWVKDIGRSRSAQAVSQARTMTRIATKLRSNMAVGALGYAADIAAGDLTNPAVAAVRFKNPKHLSAGIAESVAHPMETRKWALAKSGELRTRADELLRRFKANRNELTKRRFPGREALDAYVDHAFDLFEMTDALTATPIWVGAYREGLALFENSDEKAVEYADKLVRDTFPSQSVVDQAAIQRDKGLLGASMLFFGYLNTIYNRRRDIAHEAFLVFHDPDATTTDRAAAVAKVAWKWIAIVAAYQVLGEFLSGRGPEPDEDYGEWLLRKALMGLTVNDLPFGALAEPTVTRIAGGKARKVSVRAAPAVAVLQGAADSLGRALDGKGEAKEFFEIARSLGLVFGLPTRPVRSAEYLTEEAGKDLEAGRLNEIPAGIIYGERKNQPANPLAPGGPK